MKLIVDGVLCLKPSLILNRWFFSFIWLVAVVVGLGVLTTYAQTPGEMDLAATEWPKDSIWKKEAGLPSLVVFLHPQCSCSRATLGEVEKLLPHLVGKAQVILSFLQPKDEPEAWSKSDLFRQVQSWPGVEIRFDTEGKQSELFHAQISGEAFFYDASGGLQYHGGLTPSRGHMGDNAGSAVVASLVDGLKLPGKLKTSKLVSFLTGKVFGCEIKRIASIGNRNVQ